MLREYPIDETPPVLAESDLIFYEAHAFVLKALNLESVSDSRLWWADPQVSRYTSHGRFPAMDWEIGQFWKQIEKKEVLALGLFSIETDYHFGNVSLQSFDWINRSCEIAGVIGDPEFFGEGYMTEAFQWMIGHAFTRLNLNRLWLGTPATNIGMIRIAEKCGMVQEGILREAFEGQDVVQFGILRKEWDAEKKP